ncbi:MAG: glycosyltransferase family 4 protein [Flavobacteriaceae bacterium]|nr:glycosyltransferase family 4 protein [Flavobacteriaceae bacterium]
MKLKILFTASIAKHLLRFHLPYLQWFKEQGYEVHIACEGDEKVPFVDKKWTVPFVRSPFSIGHIKSFKILKEIIDREQYSLVHCHTPMASIVTRLAAKEARSQATKVLYTAHGFHFYNGAPFLNWLTYYPVELLMSGYADAIITINSEDYKRISQKGNQKTNYYIIPGIGVDNKRFNIVSKKEKNDLRLKKGFNNYDFIAIYAAEFINRKNHQFIIKAIAEYKEQFPNLKILFCGRGLLQEKMEILVKINKLESIIQFMGFRNDIDELYKMSDLGISSSKQEGLGLNLIEEMMCGLPILATEDRGHKEIVQSGKDGYLYKQNNEQHFIENLKKLYRNQKLVREMGKKASLSAQLFEITNSLQEMSVIYKKFLK